VETNEKGVSKVLINNTPLLSFLIVLCGVLSVSFLAVYIGIKIAEFWDHIEEEIDEWRF